MAQIKSTWWRRNTPNWPESADHKAQELRRKELKYLRWLSTEFNFGEICPKCCGLGYHSANSFYGGSRACPSCDGDGGIGIKRAHNYVAQQWRELNKIAEQAIIGIKHRLFWQGLRPVVYGGNVKPTLTVAEYDAREAERDRLNATLDAAREASYVAEAMANADYRDVTNGADLAEILAPVHAAHMCEHAITNRLWALGHLNESRWAFPGCAETIHVGTGNARRGYGYVKPTHSIVIEPGRAPSSDELDCLVQEAVEAIAPQQFDIAA